MYHGELNPTVSKRHRQGLKENKYHALVNHNPSEANPDDEMVVKLPKLSATTVLFPGSLNLTYNFKLNTGEDETSVPDHLTSALVQKLKMTIKGQTVLDINNYHHLAIYREFWLDKHRYAKELTHRGIQSIATKKKRHNVSGATDDTLASIHKERYAFHLGSFLTDAAFNPQAIHNDVEFHIKLSCGDYTLKNICLEYDYIIEPTITASIKDKYTNYTHIVNDYKSHTTKDVAKEESDFEININATFESLRAVLVFFKTDNNPSTTYEFPNITNIKMDIDGATNQLFTSDYLPQYSWEDARRYFMIGQGESHINQEKFYRNMYCLVMDLRTINDEKSSGIGREVKDYIKLKISKGVTTANCKAFVYLVADKAVSFVNNELSAIVQ